MGLGVRTVARGQHATLAVHGAARHNLHMIRHFKHKGIQRYFRSGSRACIQAMHAPRLARQLSALDGASRA